MNLPDEGDHIIIEVHVISVHDKRSEETNPLLASEKIRTTLF